MKRRKPETGSALLIAVVLMMLTASYLISVVRVVSSAIRTSHKTDTIQSSRSGTFNWLSFVNNGVICSRLSVMLEAYDPSDRLILSNEADTHSSAADGTWISWENAELLREENNRIDYITPTYTRQWISSVSPGPAHPDWNPGFNLLKYTIEQVAIADCGYAGIRFQAWTHPIPPEPSKKSWSFWFHVFYDEVVAGTKRVNHCFSRESPEFLCKLQGWVWDLSENACTRVAPATPASNWWIP